MLNDLWSFVSSWYNLPYTSLIAVSLLLVSVQLMGLGGEPAEDADADLDADAAADADADAAADAGAESDADADGDSGLDHDAGASALGLLAFLGLGKAPLFVVLPMLFGVVGLLGWLGNAFAQSVFGGLAGWGFMLTGAFALGAGGLVSAQLARLIGRALPPISTTATRAAALVGRAGTVISPFVDDHYGLVHLRNAGGTLMSVFAVADGGLRIRRGQAVVLVAYEPESRRYIVAPAELP